MYNKFMTEEQLNVQVGDKVRLYGEEGYVTEVIRDYDWAWDEEKGVYYKDETKPYTNVRIHFTSEVASWPQYQDGVYSSFHITEKAGR